MRLDAFVVASVEMTEKTEKYQSPYFKKNGGMEMGEMKERPCYSYVIKDTVGKEWRLPHVSRKISFPVGWRMFVDCRISEDGSGINFIEGILDRKKWLERTALQIAYCERQAKWHEQEAERIKSIKDLK